MSYVPLLLSFRKSVIISIRLGEYICSAFVKVPDFFSCGNELKVSDPAVVVVLPGKYLKVDPSTSSEGSCCRHADEQRI